MSEAVQHLRSLLATVVDRHGLFLEEVAVRATGKRRQVRVTVDLPDGPGGVGSDALADVSRSISAALDDDDTVTGSYVLEVSTPGTDRPLQEPRHYRRAVGRLVRLRTRSGEEVAGRLTTTDHESVVVDEASGRSRRLSYDEVADGVVEVELRSVEDAGEV